MKIRNPCHHGFWGVLTWQLLAGLNAEGIYLTHLKFQICFKSYPKSFRSYLDHLGSIIIFLVVFGNHSSTERDHPHSWLPPKELELSRSSHEGHEKLATTSGEHPPGAKVKGQSCKTPGILKSRLYMILISLISMCLCLIYLILLDIV